MEHEALSFVATHALVESAVQAACPVPLAPCQTLLQRPPSRQLSPRQTRSGQRLVKHEAVLSVLGDLEDVVDGVEKHDARLGPVRCEDQIFQFTSNTGHHRQG
jgi:hypothetical protein